MNRRIGKFMVAIPLVESGEIGKALGLMEFVPLRVEALWYASAFEYIGISPMFAEKDMCSTVPEYRILMSDKCVTVEAV